MMTSETVLSTEARAILLHALHWIASSIEMLGVMVIVLGVIAASAWSAIQIYRGEWNGMERFARIVPISGAVSCWGSNSSSPLTS